MTNILTVYYKQNIKCCHISKYFKSWKRVSKDSIKQRENFIMWLCDFVTFLSTGTRQTHLVLIQWGDILSGVLSVNTRNTQLLMKLIYFIMANVIREARHSRHIVTFSPLFLYFFALQQNFFVSLLVASLSVSLLSSLPAPVWRTEADWALRGVSISCVHELTRIIRRQDYSSNYSTF